MEQMKKSKEMKEKAIALKDAMKARGYNLKLASELKASPKMRTGIYALDYVLDGGIFQGEGGHRIEFYGRENSGKTTLTLYIIKKFQELGKKCIYLNCEHSYDTDWAEILGVDNKKLVIAEPNSLEEAGNMLSDFIGDYDLICMDSIPAMATVEELEGGMEDKHYASQSKVYSPMMRKLYSATKEHSPTMIFINQLREKVGIAYGNPFNTPGGRALKHFYNTRIEFKIGQATKNEDKETISTELLLNCVKNKRGKPHRNAAFDFYLNGYIDNNKSLFFAGIKYGIIERKGNTYKCDDVEEVGQEKFLAEMINKEKLRTYIEEEIWKRIK
jgi:recombination protein RecA